MILVTGATGHFGKKAVNFLIDKGVCTSHIGALARNEQKTDDLRRLGVQIKLGNYDDYDSLVKAFQGVDKLLFVSGSEIEKRGTQHENVVKAAKEAGVRRIVYTSFDRANDDKNSPIASIANVHIETEERIMESGMDYTFLRNAIYSEYVPLFLGPNVLERGIYLPAESGAAPYASRADMAEAAANVLIKEGHINKAYKTVNIRNYTFAEVAHLISDLTKVKVEYVSPKEDEFSSALLSAGMPQATLDGILGWMRGLREGYFESIYSDLEMLLGRKPMDLRTSLEKAYVNKQ
ncbi:MAG: SDR family oxidoreductase [Chloroflexota bacterium]